MTYAVVYFVTAVLAVITTIGARWLARKTGTVDRPETAPDRKVHQRPIPLMGGIGIFVAFFIVVAWLSQNGSLVSGTGILPKHLWGIFIGASVLMVGGFLDDRFHLSPAAQFVFPLIATGVVIATGVGIQFITNPFGGLIRLDAVSWTVLTWHGVPYHLTLWADLFSFVWILGMSYTTKFLDGLDGLVSGITAIGSFTVFVLSVRPPVLQPDTALLALILAGACTGFLVMNWHPARIFLGEGGSLLTGFLLGILAIISGGKIATALLIMGIPILDVAWVIARRVFVEHRSPFRTADRKHLHFRLLDRGLSQRQTVLFLYALTALFGAATLIFHGIGKVLVLMALAASMLLLAVILVRHAEKPTSTGPPL